MKLAASLALALAIVLGIWAASDYVENEHDRKSDLPLLETAIGHEAVYNSRMAEVNRIEEQERHDGELGIVAFCALIASVVMFSQGRKSSAR